MKICYIVYIISLGLPCDILVPSRAREMSRLWLRFWATVSHVCTQIRDGDISYGSYS